MKKVLIYGFLIFAVCSLIRLFIELVVWIALLLAIIVKKIWTEMSKLWK